MEMLLNRSSLAYVKTALAGVVARRVGCRDDNASASCSSRGFYDEKEQRKMDESGEAANTRGDYDESALIARDCLTRLFRRLLLLRSKARQRVSRSNDFPAFAREISPILIHLNVYLLVYVRTKISD
jgi:hypothetical protein